MKLFLKVLLATLLASLAAAPGWAETPSNAFQEELFRANQGDREAMYNVGYAYEYGDFEGLQIEESWPKAEYWLTKAAEAGDFLAMTLLEEHFRDKVKQNPNDQDSIRQAKKWFEPMMAFANEFVSKHKYPSHKVCRKDGCLGIIMAEVYAAGVAVQPYQTSQVLRWLIFGAQDEYDEKAMYHLSDLLVGGSNDGVVKADPVQADMWCLAAQI